ncbi:MAG: PAS domain S-box protein [Gemmatimonadetes bacterium]|nr:PAS domain S-box protein [Gemmatimonadota bacterium]
MTPKSTKNTKERTRPRQQDARQVQETLLRLQKAVETMQLGVTITDITGKIVYTNTADARMHGHAVDELVGEDVSIFCLPGYRRSLSAGQLGRMKSWQRESMNVRKDGSLFPVSLMSDVVQDAHGRPLGIVTTCEDLTESKRTEAQRERLEVQVRQSQKLESLGVLAGGVAHDLSHVLQGILGNARLVLSNVPPEATTLHEHAAALERDAIKLSDLTNQLLAYSGDTEVETAPLDLNDVVLDMVHVIEVSKAANVELRYDLGTDLPMIDADATKFRQLINHLTMNASEAIGDANGIMTVRTGVRWANRSYLAGTYLSQDVSPGRYVYLEVLDNGCGMDRETKARVFDPFFTTKAAGRGLGLAAAMGIVRGHKGVIRIDTFPERGTSFLVLIPAIEDPADGPATHDDGLG